MFWGLTPALDLLERYLDHNDALPDELDILLVGGADCRHVLQTLARRYRHAPVKLNFFVVEASVETVARQLLLLNVALQHSSVLGLVPKTKIFMELYGNTLVRPSVAKFLTSAASLLVEAVTDRDRLADAMPFVSLDLKHKERDQLENVLKFWCGRDEFNICHCWDARLRKSLGTRYDSKVGVFDWDLHMRLHPIGGSQVCDQEYRNFRLTGVAFAWLESEVSKPNRSMVCVVVPDGDKFLHCGYLGDVQTGPFVSYGLQCEDGRYLEASGGQKLHRATDVTERNLRQIFHEIQFGEEYHHESTSDVKLGPVVMRTGEKRVVDVGAVRGATGKKNKCIDLENVRVKFVSVTLLQLMKHKSEYRDFFNLIYFGCFYVKHLSKELIDHVAAKNSLILVENQKFVVTHRDKQLREFGDEIKRALDGASVKEIPFDPCNDNFATFVKV
jgi:dynein assembly factor 3